MKKIYFLGFLAAIAVILPIFYLAFTQDQSDDQYQFVVDPTALPEAGHYLYSNDDFGFTFEYPDYLPLYEGECADDLICSLYLGVRPEGPDDVYEVDNGINVELHNKDVVAINAPSAFSLCLDSLETVDVNGITATKRECGLIDDRSAVYYSITLPDGARVDFIQDTRSETEDVFEEIVMSFKLID